MGFLDEISTIKDATLLRKKLGERFAKNKEFFAKLAPGLAAHLLKPPTKYGVVAEENGVNILNLATSEFVYKLENGAHTTIAANKIIAENPFAHTKWNANSGGMDLYEIGERFKVTNANAVQMRNILEQDARFMPDFGDCHLPSKFLPPVFCYGIGAGLFLEELREKYDLQSIFIYEPEVDFFSASCHFVDYEELHNKIGSKLLAIFVNESPPQDKVREFFARQRITASFTSLELSLYSDIRLDGAKMQVELERQSNTRGWGTYEDEMIGMNNHLRNFAKPEIPILSSPKKVDAPICVVGNGASLDGSLEYLKQNIDNLIIFSCGTTLRTLRKNGIVPDFQIEIERLDYLPQILKEAGLDDIALVGANVIHPQTFALAKEKYAFFRDFTASSYIKEPKKTLHYSSPFVGNAALSLALEFSNTVILCGMDVGYKRNVGKHSKDSIYKDEEELESGSVLVEPNFEGSEIYSNALYNLSKETMERAINVKNKVKVYNMSDGAKIGLTVSHKKPPLGKIKKTIAIKKIKEAFNAEQPYKKVDTPTTEEQLQQFYDYIKGVLELPVKNKKELFFALDFFMAQLEVQYSTRPVAAILLGGSLKHLVFLLYMGMLHIKSDDISLIYRQCTACVVRFMSEAIADYKTKKASDGVLGILKQIKKA